MESPGIKILQKLCRFLLCGGILPLKKKMTETQQLLLEYKRGASEAAFETLVNRYINLVYSTAHRMVGGDHQLAEDVTQVVFVNLARKIPKLPDDIALGGWLHRDATYAARTLMRGERRRKLREKRAAENQFMHNDVQNDSSQMTPLLDEAIEDLAQEDRKAIMLRFFEGCDLRSVAQSLGTTEDAAQKRVGRALERLRCFLTKRGVRVSAAGLAGVLSASAVQSAPAGLGARILATATLSAKAIKATTTVEAGKTLFMTTMQKTLLATALAVTVGTGVFEAQKGAPIQSRLSSFEQERAPLAAEIEQLRQQRDNAGNALNALRAITKSNDVQTRELARLRNELTKLRSESRELADLKAAITNDPSVSAAKSWLDRVNKLKHGLAQSPNQQIPELQFLSDQDWLNAVRNTNELSTETDIDQALSILRNSAKNDFAGQLQMALRAYAQANAGQPPTELSQIDSYLPSPVGDAVLLRYNLAPNGVITLNSTPLDDQDDTYYNITAGEVSVTQGAVAENVLKPAMDAFAAANNGQAPANPSQLLPYVTTPAQQAVLQRAIQRWPGR
jgi:RNA polymerase sigma factor (sigma-70 family)